MNFSIVIPTYDRPAALATCLDAVARQTFPRDRFEVVVVNDGGRASLGPAVGRVAGRLNVVVHEQARSGPASARNAGVGIARGRFLAFIDDDCVPEPDWLASLWAALEETPDRLIGGRTLNGLPQNIYSTACQLITEVVYTHYNPAADDARFFASNNMAVAAGAFREIGGFDGSFVIASEDRELCDRWRHQGRRMRYVPAAVLRHAHPHSLASFCARHFSFGRGAARYHGVRAARGSGHFREEMSFHANPSNFLLTPVRRAGARRAAPMVALIALWQVSNAAGYLYERGRLALSRGHGTS